MCGRFALKAPPVFALTLIDPWRRNSLPHLHPGQEVAHHDVSDAGDGSAKISSLGQLGVSANRRCPKQSLLGVTGAIQTVMQTGDRDRCGCQSVRYPSFIARYLPVPQRRSGSEPSVGHIRAKIGNEQTFIQFWPIQVIAAAFYANVGQLLFIGVGELGKQ